MDALDGFDLDGDVDMEMDGDDEDEEDEKEEEVLDEDDEEDEDEDEDDGKEPRTIGQENTVNTSADDVDTMVDDQPIMQRESAQEMHEHTPRLQPPAPAPLPQTPQPRPQPPTPETYPFSGLEDLTLVTPQKLGLALPTQREAKVAGNTSDVDVDQPLLGKSAGGDSLPDVPLPEVCPDGSVGDKWTSHCVAEEEMIVAFRLGSGSFLVSFVLIYLSQALNITRVTRFLDRSGFILFIGFVLVSFYS